MKFRNKILLSILGIVFTLVVVLYFVVTSVTRNRIVETFSEELRSNLLTVTVFNELRGEDGMKSCMVIAESPRLKAVAEIGDRSTAHQLILDLYHNINADLVVLTDENGDPIVELYRAENRPIAGIMRHQIEQARTFTPVASVVDFDGSIYRLATAPVLIDTEILGTLTLGFVIDADEINQLMRMTNTHIAVVTPSSIFSSPAELSPSNRNTLLSIIETDEVSEFILDGSAYLGIPFRLRGYPDDPGNNYYILMKSIEKELSASLIPVRRAFLIIALPVLIATALTGAVISRGISKPIDRLVGAARHISDGAYGYMSNITARDELGILSRTFDEMSLSLKEKIDELAKLNSDLSERNEQLEEALLQLRQTQEDLLRSERLAATGKISAQLSHEINNPIHNIQSCLDTALKRTRGDSRIRELLQVAYEEVTRMSHLTRQMLNFHRTSIVEEPRTSIDLRELLDQTLKISRETLEKSGIKLAINTSDNNIPVLCSPEKIKQVLINIILNARDAMPAGGTLSVNMQAKNGTAYVSFTDTGVGIPPEHLKKIFDAFFTTKSEVRGVGLGLSVSYGIMQQHNGTIDVSSAPGKGSTFTISLPLFMGG
jgi:signal transduction histidine kinase